MRSSKSVLLLFLVSFCLLPSMIRIQINAPAAAISDGIYAGENPLIAQKGGDIINSESVGVGPPLAKTAQNNSTGSFQAGLQSLQFLSVSNSSSLVRHLMCKGYDPNYNPVDPTTIFSPSDSKAVCLTTASINYTIEFKWYYRSNSSKAWINCSDWSENVGLAGEWSYESHLFIAGYWPGAYYPRAYKVDVYLDGNFSFSDFFEVTNGGLNSPRLCGSIDANGYPVNMKSRFTVGTDTEVYHYLRFDRIAYFDEELGCSHSFTAIWIQPNGSTYRTYSGNFTDYKNVDMNLNYWNSSYITDDYITINSSTPVGNWKVEVYVDSYYLNGTWIPYGPVATTPFVIGNETVADWTFMVYLDADNPGETAGIETFLKIASIGSSPQTNVVVQMDRIGLDARYGNWTDCKRFYVTTNMTPTSENAVLDLGEVDMGDPGTLKDFVNWTIENYSARYYSLALWDHGAGVMGLCEDITNHDFLSLPKLSQALNGLPAIMDVMFLDACSMAMTEVAYQIKDYANVMVGPEALGYAPAPYDMYLSALTSNPSMSPNALATEVVNNYMYWCNYERAQGNYQEIQNATLSAIDLTRITSLSAAIDDFALDLKDNETPHNVQISLARNLTEEYPGPYAGNTSCYIDLYNFAQLINTATSQYGLGEELESSSSQLMTAISTSIIVAENISLPNSHGLAIFFPSDDGRYEAFESEYNNTAFAIETTWNEFLKYHSSGCLMTIQTTPNPYPGIPIKVDDDTYTTDASGKIQVFVLPNYHTVNVTTIISTGTDSREIFTQWKDGSSDNTMTLLVNGTTTLNPEYETQYRLTMSSNFPGTTYPPVGASWENAGSSFNISATAPQVTSSDNERYVLLTWTGTGNGSYSGTDNPASVAMNGPINEMIAWRHEYMLVIVSQYGSPTPANPWVEAGKSTLASITSPVPGPTDTQYVCIGWNGTGSVSTSGTTTSTNITIAELSSITWNWKVQYRIVVSTDPGGLSPQPNTSLPGPWYDNGTTLNCTAQSISGKVFDHWTVDDVSYDRGYNPLSIAVDGPHRGTAHYLPAPAWWENLLATQNLPFVLALFAVLAGSLAGGAWVRTRKSRVKKTHPEPVMAKVPKVALPGRIATGYQDLDNLLYGGIPEGYAVALTSPSCDEKDLLIKKFLETGTRKGDTTFYVTIDPGELKSLAEQYQSSFHLFICNPRANMMIESLPNVFELKGVENLTEISIALTSAIHKLDASQKGPRRACIEIVSDALLQHHAVQTRRWLAGLISELRLNGFTTLAVMDPEMHPSQEVRAVLDLFEGQIAIYEKETEKGLKVRKMRNQKYSENELTLRKESMETQNGEKNG